MPSVNIQFHMLLEEVIDFVSDVVSRYSLTVELERWHPKVVHVVPVGTSLSESARAFGHIDRMWLLYDPRRCRKPERFMLNVGAVRGNRLDQAALGAGTNNLEAFEVLKKIAAELKRRTDAGVWVVTTAGNVGFTKRFRVSPGAANASRSGEIELTNLFTQLVTVDPPETHGNEK